MVTLGDSCDSQWVKMNLIHDLCSAVVNGEHLALRFYFRSTWLRLGVGGIRSFWTIQCSTLTTTERYTWLKCSARSGEAVGRFLCAVEDRSLANLLARRLATSESQDGSLVQLKYELGEGSMVAALETLPPLAARLFTAA